MHKINLNLTLITLLFLSATSACLAQRVRLITDIEVIGVGLKNQILVLGNNSSEESITGMGGLSAGVNVGLPYRFEASLTGGSLLKYSVHTTTFGPYGSSTEEISFAIPKVALEIARSIIWSERQVVSGINLAIGLERYWPQTFTANGDDGKLEINYKNTFGQYFRIKMVFRARSNKFQLEPHITYRHCNLTASDYTQTGFSTPLDPTLQNLQMRNISFGVNFLFGFSNKETE